MRFGVLGRLEVRGPDGHAVPMSGPARRQVLAALVSRAGSLVGVETLIEDLWGAAPPRSALNSLRSHVARLRASLADAGMPEVVVTEAGGYRLRVDTDDVDSGRFENLVSEADDAADTRAALGGYDAALALWRDDAYVEFGDAPFAVLERIRLGELRGVARERRTDLALADGQAGELVAELEQRVRAEPYRERGWEQLALALYRAGRQVDALATCRRIRHVLVNDLGIDPGPGLRTLEQQLLRHDVDLMVGVPTQVVESDMAQQCPYLGLTGYDERNAALFVGRERVTSVIAARLADQSVVVVTGASGVGKSSVVRAGLIPALRAGALPGSAAWHIDVRTPSELPAAPVTRADLLVLDQAEELFTSVDADACDRVLAQLAGHIHDNAGRLLIAARSDFYARLADIPFLAPYAEKTTVIIGPMRADELRRAVLEPAVRTGLHFEDDLIETVLDDVTGQAEPLPLLSEALRRTWHRREGNRLTVGGYRLAGELAGAIEAAAEECYSTFNSAQRGAARRLLMRMTTRTASAWSGRPLSQADLVDPDEQQALAALIAARLVVADHGRVELTHEALLAHWPRVREWLTQRTLAVRLLEHLDQAAADWRAGGRADTDLYRGPRLSASLDWRAEHRDDLSPAEHEFLDASAHAADAELRGAREQAHRERRGRRRLRVVVAVLAAVVVMAAATTVIAVRARSSADHSANVALANSLGGQAIAEPNLGLAMLLAIEGERLNPSLQTQGALLRTVLRAPTLVRSFYSDQLRVNGMALSPDGRVLALEDNVPNVFLLDTRTGLRIGEIPLAKLPGPPSTLAFTPDGHLLFFGFTKALEPLDVDLIDPATAQVTRRLSLPAPVPAAVRRITAADAGSPIPPDYGERDFALADGGRRLAVEVAGYLVQWDLPHGNAIAAPVPVPSGGLVYYTPDGRRLIIVEPDRTIEVDATSGRVLRTYPVGGTSAALAPDGRRLVVGDDTGAVRFLDLGTGHLVESASAHPGGVTAVGFLPDGTQVVTSGNDGVSREWDVATGRVTQTFTGQAGIVGTQAISVNGSTLYTSTVDGTVLAWDLTGTQGLGRTFVGASSGLDTSGAFAFSPDGRSAAVSGYYGVVTLWDLRTLRQTGRFRVGRDEVRSLSYSPDGSSLLVYDNAQARVWRLSPKPVPVLTLPGFGRNGWAAFSPDGTTIAATGSPAGALGGFAERGHGDGVVEEWNAATGRPLAPPLRLSGGGEAYRGAFAQHGTSLGLAQLDDEVDIVDPAHSKILRRWHGSSAQYLDSVALSPDGTRLVTGDFDGYVRMWNPATGKQILPTLHVTDGVAWSTAWSPDGTRFATAGDDGAVRIYDARSSTEIGTPIIVPNLAFPDVTYTPDGRTIAVADGNGRIWLYPATAAGWAAYGCQIAARTLTTSEWKTYVPGHAYAAVCPTAH